MPSDNSKERNIYLRNDFWLDPKNWFWLDPAHTDASREYFRKFLAEQEKAALRKNRHLK